MEYAGVSESSYGGVLDEERRSYVEEFGLLFGQFGLSRMLGRVLGELMISDPPERSAGELAEALGASRGSISQTTRSLIQMGLVSGGRGRVSGGTTFGKAGGVGGIMRREMEALGGFREAAERGLVLLDSRTPRQAQPGGDARLLRLLGEGDARRAGAVGEGIADQGSQPP